MFPQCFLNCALIKILSLACRVWGSVCAGVRNSTDILSHALRGVKGNWERADNDEVILSLNAPFEVLMSYSDVEVMRFVKYKTGEMTECDGAEDTLYLPISMGKRHCYRRRCSNRGWTAITKANVLLLLM